MHELPALYLLTRGWASTFVVLTLALCLHLRLRLVARPEPLTLLD
jgi:hypothetical protein